MSHDTESFKPLDPGRVNSLDPIEMNYWCGEFGCSEAELNDAVAKVGEHVTEIRQLLADQSGR